MEEVLLLTRIVPGGSGRGPPPKGGRRRCAEPLLLGVTQVAVGAGRAAVGGTLLAALRDPIGATLGAAVGGGGTLMVSGAVLMAMAKGPSVGRARAALALGVVSAIASLLELLLHGVLLPHGCPTCALMGPGPQAVVWGARLFLLTSAAVGVALAVTGAVAAGRGGATRGGAPVVIYQTALPGAGPGEAPPTAPAPQ